jgi:hypothetical protein
MYEHRFPYLAMYDACSNETRLATVLNEGVEALRYSLFSFCRTARELTVSVSRSHVDIRDENGFHFNHPHIKFKEKSSQLKFYMFIQKYIS